MTRLPTLRAGTTRAVLTVFIALAALSTCTGGDGPGQAHEVEAEPMSGIPNPEALEAVIGAERAFSAMSTEAGMRDAFVAYFAEDAVSFAPEPTVGTAELAAGPEGPKLEWWPEIAEASLAGDMGYTSGPYRAPLPDGSFAWGHYHSVWGIQPDGSWKVLLDMGGPHGEVAVPTAVERPESSWAQPAESADGGSLLDRDRAFLQAYQSDGDAALRAFALPRARFYRFRQAPLLGVGEALRDRAESAEQLRWEPINGRVASSGDLGYTYGTGTVVRQEAVDATHEMSYARVWRRTPDREWHLVLEVVLPYPPAGTGG